MDLLERRMMIARLIAKELTGTMDEREREELSRWLAEDGRHQEEYERLKISLETNDKVWEEQAAGHRMTDARWELTKQRIRKQRRIVWSRYAAAIVLPLTIAAFWFISRDTSREQVPVQTVAITHGVMKAQLQLADGRKVELNDTTRLRINEVGGTEIQTSDKMVKYTGSDSVEIPLAGERYNTLRVPRGGEFALELADGTRVWLNSESTLKYPVHFTGDLRKVEMTGEGYFEVAKNAGKPFVVAVNGVNVRVLGTSFNVSAYSERVVTTLVEGKVQLQRGADSVILIPNQQGIWRNGKLGFVVKQVEARNYSLWREGIFYFEDTDLETILDVMARWYNVNIFYVNPGVKSMKFSVEVKRYENIEQILRRIEQTKRVKFDIKDRTINVCE
ncbi:FecR domain-containing protein [Butyricimonas hominis]|uniref:FecR domain-containing protein n=1 Tax=Butyricimonas hominis TaxID=2763032 RepID=A0ABR7D4V3_9BACT|nr:FecR domain-containing protein [Butyricimonas hominis]MBC5622988.1 FecR domain-containing protein [Butyricimonas hominis]